MAQNNFMNILSLSQHNSILNTFDRLLNLVIHNKTCLVERFVNSRLSEDEYHPALSIWSQMNLSSDIKNKYPSDFDHCFNFRKTHFLWKLK